MLQPTLVESAPKVFASLGVEDTSYEHILDFSTVEGKIVTKGESLFPRLDVKKECEYIASQMKG